MKKYKYILSKQKMTRFLISQQIFFFFLGAFGGFIWEVILYLIQDGTFVKRGFFHGPWLPIYGTGAVTFYLLLAHPIKRARALLIRMGQHSHGASIPQPIRQTLNRPFRQTATAHLTNLLKLFSLSLLIGTGIELVIGWFLDTFFGLRYWTYEGVPFNFHGYICVSSSLCFGLAGVIWVGYLSDFVTRLWIKIPIKIREEINTILVLLFLLDCVAALLLPNMGNSITFH